MQKLNVFVIGEGKICPELIGSKLLNKLYTTSDRTGNNTIQIPFENIDNLIQKCKGLQIDIVIVEDCDLFSIGVIDILRQNHINCFGANKVWAEILQDDLCSRKLANRYQISKPAILNYPKEFPLIVKADGFTRKAHDLKELLEIKETIPKETENIYLEEYLEGDKIVLTSLFDGKSLLDFPVKNLTDRQNSKLKEYSAKLTSLLKEEKADFLGFINSKLIWHDNNWNHLRFDLGYVKPTKIKHDLLFILTSAIYQKLDEINLS